MERLLLHHCCAPCSPKVVEILKQDYIIESFWFNPNIEPKEENEKRKNSLIDFVNKQGFKLHLEPEISESEWLQEIKHNIGINERCGFCYTNRLSQTAYYANKLGIKYFSTTLLSSPYQKHSIIQNLAEKIAFRNNLHFIYKDFRPFYYDGKNAAYRNGSYIQKYCGCILSFEERMNEKTVKLK